MNTYYQIWMSAENHEQAQNILNSLTHKKCIVGGTILNGPSHFWWEGEENDMDYSYVMAFSIGEKLETLEVEYKRISVEDIPMLSIIEMKGNTEFLDFIRVNTL